MRTYGKPIALTYSPILAFNPNSPSVIPIVGGPYSEGRNSFTPACLAASAMNFWSATAFTETVDATTSMSCSLNMATRAGTSLNPAETAFTPDGKDLADDDSGRVTTTTFAPSERRAFINCI